MEATRLPIQTGAGSGPRPIFALRQRHILRAKCVATHIGSSIQCPCNAWLRVSLTPIAYIARSFAPKTREGLGCRGSERALVGCAHSSSASTVAITNGRRSPAEEVGVRERRPPTRSSISRPRAFRTVIYCALARAVRFSTLPQDGQGLQGAVTAEQHRSTAQELTEAAVGRRVERETHLQIYTLDYLGCYLYPAGPCTPYTSASLHYHPTQETLGNGKASQAGSHVVALRALRAELCKRTHCSSFTIKQPANCCAWSMSANGAPKWQRQRLPIAGLVAGRGRGMMHVLHARCAQCARLAKHSWH